MFSRSGLEGYGLAVSKPTAQRPDRSAFLSRLNDQLAGAAGDEVQGSGQGLSQRPDAGTMSSRSDLIKIARMRQGELPRDDSKVPNACAETDAIQNRVGRSVSSLPQVSRNACAIPAKVQR